ncbi:ricin-type beta-trefoil lectin domain protein, partial [Kibdelosporangium lantanae]
LGTVTDTTFAAGQVGLATSQGETAQFDNLAVTGSGGGSTSALRNTNSSRCLDVPNVSQTNGTQVTLWDCNSGSNQQWTLNTAKQLQVYGNKCLDASGQGTTPGTKAVIWDCTGATNQQWNVNTDGTITGVQSGLCLAPTGTGNSAPVTLQTCDGSNGQKWTRS